MSFTATTRSGFTLIELLVVISIIGVLAGVVLVSLNDSRDKAFNARRESQVEQLLKALELYYADNGQYPYDATDLVSGTDDFGACLGDHGGATCTGGGPVVSEKVFLNNAIVPQYMSSLPTIEDETITVTVGGITANLRGVVYVADDGGQRAFIGFGLHGEQDVCLRTFAVVPGGGNTLCQARLFGSS